jgi:hypothetical protein
MTTSIFTSWLKKGVQGSRFKVQGSRFKVQRFKGSKVQRFKGSRLKGFFKHLI